MTNDYELKRVYDAQMLAMVEEEESEVRRFVVGVAIACIVDFAVFAWLVFA